MQSIPERSTETKALFEYLSTIKEGDVVPYDKLRKVCGEDVRERRWLLSSARRWLMREKDIVFGAVVGVGIKRLTQVQVLEDSESFPKRLRRMAYRERRKLGTIQYEPLSQEQRTQLDIRNSLCALVSYTTRKPTMERIAGAVSIANKQLPPVDLLAAFRTAKE